MKKITTIQRRRREPDEIATLRVSVRNHCLECMGYSPDGVVECTAKKCWLNPWRTGKTPPELKRKDDGKASIVFLQNGNGYRRRNCP